MIKHQQKLTGLDLITLANLQLLNSSTRLSGQLHKVAGLERADGVDPLGEFHQPSSSSLNLRRRRQLRCFAPAGTNRDQSRDSKQEALQMRHGKKALKWIMRWSQGKNRAAKICKPENRQTQKASDLDQLKH